MTARSSTRTNSALLVALLAAQLLLMTLSTQREDGANVLESAVLRLTSPFARLAAAVGGGFSSAAESVRSTFAAKAENRRLERELRQASERETALREAELENVRLRRLLGMRQSLAPKSIGARVVTASLTGQSRMMVLDRGTADGVNVDCGVVAWGGAVGRVVYADARFCKVVLLTDPNSGVAGVIQRSRAKGIVKGQGDGPLVMEYVSDYADVLLGDHVVTSGLDGIFPPGYTIGRVSYVASGEDVSKVIRILPAVRYRDLEEVLVLTEPPGEGLLPPPAVESDR